MPKTEDGEFELVLGNKQLLSVFFIMVVLLGVFFTMGYIVGRSTRGGEASTQVAQRPPETGEPDTPIVVDPPGSDSQDKPAPSGPPEATQAAAPSPEPARPTPVETPVARQEPPSPPPTTGNVKGTQVEPAPGQTFLQVAAVKPADADLLVEVLAKKGFIARVAPVPGEELLRVLVGPLKDDPELAKTRSDLEAAGFKTLRRTY